MDLKFKQSREEDSDLLEKPRFPRALNYLLAATFTLLLTLIVIEDLNSQESGTSSLFIRNSAAKVESFEPSVHQPLQANEAAEVTTFIPDDSEKNLEGKHFPEVMVIGVREGGFNSLMRILEENSQIKISHKNKLHHRCHQHANKTARGRLTVGVAPEIFTNETAAKEIFLKNPDTKLILTVRDPVDRLIVDYVRQILDGRITSLLPEKDTVRHFRKISHQHQYSMRKGINTGQYSVHLEKWLKYFRPEQILIVPFEKLIENPEGQIKRVERFLHLESKNMSAEKLEHLMHKSRKEELKMFRLLKKRYPSSTFIMTRHALRFTYRPFVNKLVQLTGDKFYETWL